MLQCRRVETKRVEVLWQPCTVVHTVPWCIMLRMLLSLDDTQAKAQVKLGDEACVSSKFKFHMQFCMDYRAITGTHTGTHSHALATDFLQTREVELSGERLGKARFAICFLLPGLQRACLGCK